jgi:hypothetical protein
VGTSIVRIDVVCTAPWRHSPECTTTERFEQANRDRAWGTGFRLGAIIDERLCCSRQPADPDAICGWAGDVDAEVTGLPEEEHLYWRCPRCNADHDEGC